MESALKSIEDGNWDEKDAKADRSAHDGAFPPTFEVGTAEAATAEAHC